MKLTRTEIKAAGGPAYEALLAFVISLRANTLKNNATHDEILKIAAYLARHPSEVGHG